MTKLFFFGGRPPCKLGRRGCCCWEEKVEEVVVGLRRAPIVPEVEGRKLTAELLLIAGEGEEEEEDLIA